MGSRQQSHGRRVVTMGDRWREILSQQARAPQPVHPAEHVEAKWCGCRWECACQPTAKPPGATRD